MSSLPAHGVTSSEGRDIPSYVKKHAGPRPGVELITRRDRKRRTRIEEKEEKKKGKEKEKKEKKIRKEKKKRNKRLKVTKRLSSPNTG